MRIHSLRFAGIGPFREEQQIDFDSLSGAGMFLLEGPTGVGKSTIIDAIVFALYGRTAAEEGDAERLVSHFRAVSDQAPFAEMVFSTARGTFRVRRSPGYKRLKAHAKSDGDVTKENATATLLRLNSPADLDGTPMGSGVAEISKVVIEVVGLNREQFISTIVLPQGEFARFLRSSTDDRRKILQSIFRTQLFQKVQERLRNAGIAAERECKAADDAVRASLDTLRGALGETHAEPLAEVAPDGASDAIRGQVADVIDQIAEQREQTEAARAVAEESYQAARACLSDIDDRIKKRDALAAATKQMAELDSRAAEIADAESALSDDERAGRVADAVTAADQRGRAAAKAQQELESARLAAPAALAEADENALQQVSQSARRTLGELQAVLRQEKALPGKLAKHDGLLSAAEALRERIAGWEAQSNQLPSDIALAREHLAEQQSLAGQVQQINSSIAELGQRAKAANQLVELAKQRQSAEGALADQLAKAQESDARVGDLTARYRAGIAATIGVTLTPGEPCPACGSCEHPNPAAPSDDHVTSDEVDAATEAAAQQRRRVESAQQSVADLQARRAELTATAQGTTVEQARAENGALQSQLNAARAAERDAAKTQQSIDQLTRRQEQLIGDLRTGAQELAGHEATAKALLADIEEERCAVQEAAAGFPTVADRAEHLREEANSSDALLALHQAAQARAAAAKDASADLADALSREQFADVAAVKAAALTAAKRSALKATVQSHRTDVIKTQSVLDRADLQGVDPSEQIDRGPAAETLAQAQHHRDELVGRLNGANALLNRARKCGADLDRTVEARDKVQASLRTTILLGNFAKGRNRLDMDLATFVVVHRFASVIEAANHHLTDMSNGRLSLESFEETTGNQQKGGLGIRVFDHHTEQARSPKTLSGGETFFTSLSLALGLAEIVTAENGGVALDTLFVDEGFGSLDQETLDNVMAALEGLQRDGRVLGLVSHVTEMKERIPERIEVRRSREAGPSELHVVA